MVCCLGVVGLPNWKRLPREQRNCCLNCMVEANNFSKYLCDTLIILQCVNRVLLVLTIQFICRKMQIARNFSGAILSTWTCS